MKICQVGSSLHDWGGIERYLVYLTEALEARGHEVWTSVPPGSPLDKRLTGRKAHVDLRRQFQFSRLAAYLRLFRSQKFDVVNAHFSPDYIIPAIAAKLARQPCRVLTRHVVITWSATKVRRYTRLFTHFVGVSDAVGKKLVDSGIPADLVQVAKAGCPAIEPTLSAEAVRQQMAISGFAAGFFGRIVGEKGISMLMEASAKLPPETIHAFGDGALLTPSKSQTSGVRFHGRVEDVGNAMNAMDCVLIPSLWEEAFGFSALEAMSLGKPIVATRSGGLPELVVPDETGFLIEKRDSQALVDAILMLESNPILRARLGAIAKERHRTEYTVEKFGERMEAAYMRAAGLS